MSDGPVRLGKPRDPRPARGLRKIPKALAVTVISCAAVAGAVIVTTACSGGTVDESKADATNACTLDASSATCEAAPEPGDDGDVPEVGLPDFGFV